MKPCVNVRSELQVKLFKNKGDWATWLDKNQAISLGLWLRIAKKSSDIKLVAYAEALEIAICYGWINGQKKTCDEFTWLQKFTPRGARSIWSAINREKTGELIQVG